MAPTAIDITPGSATANAYVSVAVADQYQADRPAVGTTWADATPDRKIASILWATRLMDSLWEWSGYPVDTIQALLWPRGAILKRNRWEYESLTAIPTQLQWATAEYARQLLVSDRTGDSDIETQGITSVKAGPVSLTFKDSVYAKQVPDVIIGLIPPWWGYVRSRSNGTRDLVRT